MNGISKSQSGGYSAVPANWHIIETGDFNGDGKSDILWRDFNSGAVAIWLLNGLQVLQSGNAGSVPLNWQIQGANAD